VGECIGKVAGKLDRMSETSPNEPAPTPNLVQFLRALCHLICLAVITWWALAEWPLPWPGIAMGAVFFVLVVLLWALFLSPRPVLRVDRFARGLFELLLIAGAVAAMLSLGVHWALAAGFGVIAAVLGYIGTPRRSA